MEQNSPWKQHLFSRSLKLLDAGSPTNSNAKAVLNHLNSKKDVKHSDQKPIIRKKESRKQKRRDLYYEMIDDLIKDYAKQEHIAVQIPQAIRKNSFKDYRIIDPESPNSKKVAHSPPVKATQSARKSNYNSPRENKTLSLKKRINT